VAALVATGAGVGPGGAGRIPVDRQNINDAEKGEGGGEAVRQRQYMPPLEIVIDIRRTFEE
jgi:hypothetical protein